MLDIKSKCINLTLFYYTLQDRHNHCTICQGKKLATKISYIIFCYLYRLAFPSIFIIYMVLDIWILGKYISILYKYILSKFYTNP